jgi:cytochrome c-type biogenesis protein
MGHWLESLNGWLAGSPILALVGAAGWGVASILLSPCHLASIPLIIGYMAGEERIRARRAALISLAFAGGMLLTIALVGGLAALVGRALGGIGSILTYGMAVVFLVVGMEFLGVFEFNWRVPGVPAWLGRGPMGALLLGLLFGLALGPCTFAFLAPVLTAATAVAASDPLLAGGLTLAYGIGHCGVIVVAGSSLGMVQGVLTWNERSRGLILFRRAIGVFLTVGGIYLLYQA